MCCFYKGSKNITGGGWNARPLVTKVTRSSGGQWAVGSWQWQWQLAGGSWQLAVGSWQLAVGSWQWQFKERAERIGAQAAPACNGAESGVAVPAKDHSISKSFSPPALMQAGESLRSSQVCSRSLGQWGMAMAMGMGNQIVSAKEA